MADDTKLILRELEKINQRMGDMHGDLNGKMNAMHDDLDSKINAIHDNLNGKINDLNGKIDAIHDDLNGKIIDLNDKMDAIHDDLNDKIIDLQKANTKIQVLIETEIIKMIDLIGNGHDFLQMRVNEALKMEEKWEGMGLEQIMQRIELNKLKDHLGIA